MVLSVMMSFEPETGILPTLCIMPLPVDNIGIICIDEHGTWDREVEATLGTRHQSRWRVGTLYQHKKHMVIKETAGWVYWIFYFYQQTYLEVWFLWFEFLKYSWRFYQNLFHSKTGNRETLKVLNINYTSFNISANISQKKQS